MLTKKDYYLVSLIGFCIALFSVPIGKNVIPESYNFSFSFLSVLVLVIFLVAISNVALFIASWLNEKISFALQVAKFVAVGGFNTLLDFSVLNLLMFWTGYSDDWRVSLFKGISFVIANSSAYFWNKHWAFQSDKESNSKEIVSFIFVSVCGFLINNGIFSLIVFAFKGTSLVTPELLANLGALLATMVSLVWNFFGYKILVFKK
jgi:putative flippase GtrA